MLQAWRRDTTYEEMTCFGKKTLAIDGIKIRAHKASKNNFNEKKVERHLAYLDNKMEVYLQQMDQLDHADELNEEVRDSKLKIKEKLQQLKERKINYEKLKQLCEASIDGQVSTTDRQQSYDPSY